MKHPVQTLVLCTLLAASGGAWAQSIPPVLIDEMHHPHGRMNPNNRGGSSAPATNSGGTYRPSYTVGHTIERRYGSAAVGVTQRNQSDNSGNLGQIYTAVSHSREAADREALGKCSHYDGKNCIVIARVANACTNINKATADQGSNRDGPIPAPTRFYVSPYVTPQQLPYNNGNSLELGVQERVKETAEAACQADAARNKHGCEYAGTTLCAWDRVERMTGSR